MGLSELCISALLLASWGGDGSSSSGSTRWIEASWHTLVTTVWLELLEGWVHVAWTSVHVWWHVGALTDEVTWNVALAANIGWWWHTGTLDVLWAILDQVAWHVALVANVTRHWDAWNAGWAVLDQVAWLVALVADVARWDGLVQGAELDEVAWNVALAADVAWGWAAPSIQRAVLDHVTWGVALLADIRWAGVAVWAVADEVAGHVALVANIGLGWSVHDNKMKRLNKRENLLGCLRNTKRERT